MLTVTETAIAYLAGLLSNANTPYDVAIRFVLEEGKVTTKLDRERPNDPTYQYAGSTILLLDEHIVATLRDRTLDVQDTDDDLQFVFRQP